MLAGGLKPFQKQSSIGIFFSKRDWERKKHVICLFLKVLLIHHYQPPPIPSPAAYGALAAGEDALTETDDPSLDRPEKRETTGGLLLGRRNDEIRASNKMVREKFKEKKKCPSWSPKTPQTGPKTATPKKSIYKP